MANGVEQFKSGDLLFAQGEIPQGLYMLQSGSVEILSASKEFDGLDRNIIVSKSQRVGIIKTKSMIAGFSRNLTEPYTKSVRALSDCSVSKYPLVNGGMKGMAISDPNQSITVLRQLYNLMRAVSANMAKYTKLFQTMSMISDNVALIYKELSQTNASDELHSLAESLYESFSQGGGSLPAQVTARFLIADNSGALGKQYGLPDRFPDLNSSKKLDEMVVKFLRLDPSILKAAFKADPTIAVSMYDSLSESYQRSLGAVGILTVSVDRELNRLFSADNSWSSFLAESGGFDQWKSSGKMADDFIKNFLSLLSKVNTMYEEMTGKKMSAIFPGIKKIHDYYSSVGGAAPASASAPAGEAAVSSGAPAVVPAAGSLSKSIHQIFEFAMVPKDDQKRLLLLISDFKNAKNPFNTESEGRKLRRNITKMYWEVYKQAFVRSLSEKGPPLPVQLMLNFGYFDEELVEESQINELRELSRMREKSRDIPVLLETEFLRMVHGGDVEPSITEMGLNYKGWLREQERHKSKKALEAEPKGDESIKKTLYEIDQRLSYTSAVCSGSTSTAFPILSSLATRGSLKGIYVSKRKVEAITKEVQTIDFSVFYRETVLKLGEAREIIQEEVIPYFILLPIYGSRTLLWQDLSGTNKRSRGRVVVPIFFMGDLKKSLLHTFASFRWELTKTIKGAMWADPIEGGITGEYFDYVNTYKKMSKLSQEMKQKIGERFKSLRTNRDRFADDYIQWVMYEKDGIMKQNNVVREMFYKHVPFTKDIRAKLEAMPAFSQAANRYKNIHKREVDAYERRFKKYQDESGEYPIEIKKFFEFLNK